MGSMMTGLYVGLSGLVTSSNSLNATANNLTNVNTKGYVRQSVIGKDVMYNDVTTSSGVNQGQSGLGVTVQEINHVRDMFLDMAYRKESGRQNFYEKMYDAIYEIETQMGNTDGIDGIGFQSSLNNMRASLNTLAEAPGDITYRSSVVQSAVKFLDSAKLIYDGLKGYQSTLNDEIISTVNRINSIGDEIRVLNRKVQSVEAGQIEGANDARDQRDLLLDELSSYCKISYKEDALGVVEVSVEGVPFVDELSVCYMGYRQIEGTDLVEPIWPELTDQPVYNLNGTISTEKNTDIGMLKGLLAARGSINPTVSSMVEPNPTDYTLGENDPDYISKLDEYNRFLTSQKTSTIVNTMANLDKLINSIVESVNDIFCPEIEATYTVGGQTVTAMVLDTDKAPTAKDGTYGVELFKRDFTDRYTQVKADNGEIFYVRNDINSYGNRSYYSITNVTVNDEIINDYSKMALTTKEGADDYDTCKALVDIFTQDKLLYKDGIDSLSFEEFYETMMSDVATTGKIYKSMAENEATLANNLDGSRQEVIGVSSDEELGSMIKYQQAYNASSRYINVVSEMIETLINKTGA